MTRIIAICLTTIMVCLGTAAGQTSPRTTFECEVLEVSGAYTGTSKDLSTIHYAMIRHKNDSDRDRLSAWLRSKSGSEVTFMGADGRPHRGVLRRLRMCFGRGLLVFTDAVDVKEGEVLRIEL